jgi:hypothetical protein
MSVANTESRVYAYFANKVTPVTLPDTANLVSGQVTSDLTPETLTDAEISALKLWCNEGFIHTFLVLFDVTCGLFFRKLAGIGTPFITISSRMGLAIRARQQAAIASGTQPKYPWGLMAVVLFLQWCEKDHCSKALMADFARGVLGAKLSSGK